MHAFLFSELSTTIQSMFNNVKSKVDQYILDAGPTLLGNLVAAAAIFFVGKWIAGFTQRVIVRLMNRARVDETLSKFLSRIAYALMMCAVTSFRSIASRRQHEFVDSYLGSRRFGDWLGPSRFAVEFCVRRDHHPFPSVQGWRLYRNSWYQRRCRRDSYLQHFDAHAGQH